MSSPIRLLLRAWCVESRALLCVALWIFVAVPSLATQDTPPEPSPMAGLPSPSELPDDFFDALEYRFVGPLGNRVPAVVGVPGDPLTYYVGAASGGIFKSEDGGHSWRPIFDDMPSASIGALAVSPSDPNVVWVGTGEAFIRSNVSIGDGVYRSTDAGITWQHVGLSASGRISRILTHPEDHRVAYVAALGHGYGPQEERGVFKTTDGGETWEKVLFVDAETGCSDLVMDPNNPRILFAGMWDFEMSTFSRTSGGPGSGLWRSKDAGKTWERLTGQGLPEAPWGKIGLTMTAADSRRLYALIETNTNRDFADLDAYQGTLWRSDDRGDSWTMVNDDNTLHQRPLYYTRLLAAPDDADEVHFMAARQSLSLDGGRTSYVRDSGWDHHDMWIDPLQPDRMITGHDGGISISWNRGETWFKPQLPIAQMYHVAVDDQIPYFLYGNRQDGDAMRGPSNTLAGAEIPIGAWKSVAGCEVGFTLPTPGNSDRVWSGCYDGILDLYDGATGHYRNVSVWPEAVESWHGQDLEYRFHWTFPMAISPHDPDRVYVGSQFLHRTDDAGQSWQVISPDLTSNNPDLQRRTGGLTLDDAGPTLGPSLFAIAESPLTPGVLWTGSNDGRVHSSSDGGRNWDDVTANLPELNGLGTISNIEPSRHDPKTVYLTVDRHQEGDFETYVYRSRDLGRSWKRVIQGIPQTVHAYAHCVKEDPSVPGLLYLGTENGLWISFDSGESWRAFQSNLPRVPVHWIEIQDHFQDLVVATYGRGFWILDDLTPVQALAKESSRDPGPYLFEPRSTYRFRSRQRTMAQAGDPVAGRNPQQGAGLHWYLSKPAESVRLEILDAEGEVVRSEDEMATEAGLHRWVWDLAYDATATPKLRTPPLEGGRGELGDGGWRRLTDGGPLEILVPPGAYRIRLVIDDGEREIVRESSLDLMLDPASSITPEQLERQYEVLLSLRQMAGDAAAWINEAEWLRKQLRDLDARLSDSDSELGSEEDVSKARDGIEALATELEGVEGRFFDLRLTDAGQDTLRWKRLLWAKIGQLARHVGAGDYPPTDSQLEVHDVLEERMEAARARFEQIVNEDLPAFQNLLRELGWDGLIVGF